MDMKGMLNRQISLECRQLSPVFAEDTLSITIKHGRIKVKCPKWTTLWDVRYALINLHDRDLKLLIRAGPYVKDLIPPNVGSGPHRKNVQARTLGVWIALTFTALGIFFQEYVDIGPKHKAAALGLIFPGAGYLASANVLSGILFVVTWASIPLALFAVSQPYLLT